MDKDLMQALFEATKKGMRNNKRFHTFDHAMEVFINAQKLIPLRGGDETVILAAALLHDLSNRDDERDEVALAEKVLTKIKLFPREKIKDVLRIITSINGKAILDDEIIVNEADRMAVFSKLSLVRAMMMYGKKGLPLELATADFWNLINRKYNGFKLQEAKEMVKDDWEWMRNFLCSLHP